ncbi:hypothetical protein ACQEV9_00285 [Streptomyces chartreusis]|uniref:hypothetical protein n=1 Tax=Streptomyces chartreusis TaxID=1969 RepID=UPI003D91D6A1
MRLTTVRISSDSTAAARVERRRLVLLPFPDVSAILATGEHWHDHSTSPGTPTATATDAGPLVTGLAVLTEACFDFALTGDGDDSGHWTAIECNPNGQWGWLPDADAISEAFADILNPQGGGRP